MNTKMASDTHKARSFLQGLILGVVGAAVIIYLFSISGLIVVSNSRGVSIVGGLHWCYDNLGLSLIPFGIVFTLYWVYLRRLSHMLDKDDPRPEEIGAAEEKINLLINVFFGIGVIWTAIGMRNALVAALGNMDAEIAARKGAFFILTQLVEGGILIALSTTIFGGIGGYIMRMLKSWVNGARLVVFYEQLEQKERAETNDQLRHIAGLLERMAPPVDNPRYDKQKYGLPSGARMSEPEG